MIDNYDSFTYNLVQYIGDLGQEICVYRNDALTSEEILDKKPQGIIISPGPCAPDQAGICVDLIQKAANENVPLFGVCLGLQSIGQAFGGKIIRETPMHGKISPVFHEEIGVFKNLPSPFQATRYHSLVVDPNALPDSLEVTAHTEDGHIMGLRHKEKIIESVQFHPESIATEHGHQILRNFFENIC